MEIKKYYVWNNRLSILDNPPHCMDEMTEVCKYEDMKRLVEENEILKEVMSIIETASADTPMRKLNKLVQITLKKINER